MHAEIVEQALAIMMSAFGDNGNSAPLSSCTLVIEAGDYRYPAFIDCAALFNGRETNTGPGARRSTRSTVEPNSLSKLNPVPLAIPS
jgi:hypothetical protein